jgi:GAF domain-containing protein
LAESNERALQLETAAEIARETSGTLEMDALLRKAITLVRERFNFYHASVFLLDGNGEYAVVKESTGDAGRKMIEEGHKLQVGSKSVMGYVTASGEPLVINDVSQDPTHHFNPLLPETQSELGIPLKLSGRILGALDVQSTELYAFSQDDIEVLQILADQLAVAVANAELFAETQEHLSQHRLIYDTTTIAASSPSLEEALASVVEGLRATLGERVAILLLDNQKNELYITASAGYGDDLIGMRIDVGRGITGWVAQHREPLIINDVQADPRYIPGNNAVRSELAVPIIYRGELLGVLNIESDEPDAFNQQDQDILSTVAGSLAATMINTRLSERQQQLFEVTNKIRRSVNMGTILETTANELSRVLNARRARIEVGVRQFAQSSTPENGNTKELGNGSIEGGQENTP